MWYLGKNLTSIAIGLFLLAIAIQVLWSILIQFKVWLVLGLLLLGSIWVIRRIQRYRDVLGDLFLR
jgi:hypothetical protein